MFVFVIAIRDSDNAAELQTISDDLMLPRLLRNQHATIVEMQSLHCKLAQAALKTGSILFELPRHIPGRRAGGGEEANFEGLFQRACFG